jgi:hypothetical protein
MLRASQKALGNTAQQFMILRFMTIGTTVAEYMGCGL